MVVGIERGSLGLFLDQLQRSKEFFGGLGYVGDTSSLENFLVVKDAIGVSGGSNAINFAIKGGFINELIFFAQFFYRSERHEEIRILVGGERRRDIQYVAVVFGVHTGRHFARVVRD